MTNKYSVEFKEVVEVSFENPEKTESYFITDDPDGWQDSFFPINDLEDLAKTIAGIFKSSQNHYNHETHRTERRIEGFGNFERLSGSNKYVRTFDNDVYGTISIEVVDEMYIDDVWVLKL
jgi:hypothetical protein